MDNDTISPIGEFLKALYKEHRYSVAAIATETGIDPARLYAYQVSGGSKRIPDALTVNAILDFIGVHDEVKARALEALAASQKPRSRAA